MNATKGARPSRQKIDRPILATHVITRLIVGGAQENTVSTVLGLQQRQEFQTDLVTGPTQGPEGSLEAEYRKHSDALTILPTIIRPVRPLTDLKGLFDLKRLFLRTRPTIVHTHSGKAGVLGRWAASAAGVPIIIHGIHGPSFGAFQGTVTNVTFRAAERSAGKRTHFFVAVAQAMIDQYLAAGIGTPEVYQRVFSGFPLEPFLNATIDAGLRKKWGMKESDFVVGKIARMCELKGHDDLFKIAPELIRRVPNVKFLLIGGGPWQERFRRQAEAIELNKHFVFTGLVRPEEIPSLAGIMDVLVHLSYREGLPRALPQAMAAGKPVVAFDCDGAKEVCITGETGFLVSLRDHKALLDALATLAGSLEIRRQLGARGREFVRERFPVERMVEDTYQIYLRLLRERGFLKVSVGQHEFPV
jgi:glycosyltransferase involved in cell wall biosynthesis